MDPPGRRLPPPMSPWIFIFCAYISLLFQAINRVPLVLGYVLTRLDLPASNTPAAAFPPSSALMCMGGVLVIST